MTGTSTKPKRSWPSHSMTCWPPLMLCIVNVSIHMSSKPPAAIDKDRRLHEDCAYCPQSATWNTNLEPARLMATEEIVEAARRAKAASATRFCMGAAWRSPTDRQVDQVAEAVAGVKALGLETCVTLGMLSAPQAETLADAGLDFYNHNLDTSPYFYGQVITTRVYQDRLDTLANLRTTAIKLCVGGTVEMGESRRDRAGLLAQLTSLDPHPEWVLINVLVRAPGTPLFDMEPLDPLELVRTIATARLMMPTSVIRLSAGRTDMTAHYSTALTRHAPDQQHSVSDDGLPHVSHLTLTDRAAPPSA